jgi:diguanylate cyclase (GGDEF)-like protein
VLRLSLKAKVVALTVLVAIAAQCLLVAFMIRAENQRSESESRSLLDVAERIVGTRVTQMREQGTLAAQLALRDPVLAKAVAVGHSDALASALTVHGKRATAVRGLYVRANGDIVVDAAIAEGVRAQQIPAAVLRSALVAGKGSGFVGKGDQTLMWTVGADAGGGAVFLFPVARRVNQDLAVLKHVRARIGLATALDASRTEPYSPMKERRLYLTESSAETVAVDLLVSAPSSVDAVRDAAMGWLPAFIAALAISAALAAALMTRWMSPLARMREAVRGILASDYTPLAVNTAGDELGLLAQSFNVMLEGIRQRERKILQTAYRDPLTSLPNRTLYHERLTDAVQQSRKAARSIAVMLVDINQFKAVNESLGHAAGDALLREVADRIRGTLRNADSLIRVESRATGAQPTLARLGSDDFAVLLPGCTAQQGSKVAARLVEVMRRPFMQDGQSVLLAATVGVAAFPEHAQDSQGLMQAADTALHEAKARQSSIVSYDPEHERSREIQLSLLGDLRRALELDELHLLYQPKVGLAGDSRLMVEALLRWEHPERGPQNPATFVPFAEKTGFITTLTRWVLDNALSQTARWKQAGLDVQVAVNVSARDVTSEDFTTYIIERLRHYDLSPQTLTIEITETAMVKEPQSARKCLQILDRFGVKFAIDDFGTGFSSLSYLRELPVDAVKIDRGFVSAMLEDAGSRVIVKSTIELAHSLSLRAIAEGVENAETLQALRALGCDFAQGYYFGKPLTAQAFTSWVEHQSRRFMTREPDGLAQIEIGA